MSVVNKKELFSHTHIFISFYDFSGVNDRFPKTWV